MSITDKAQAHALLIDGQEVQTSATRVVHDPATGEPIAEVADASAADAERAVAAARAAFRRGDWSRVTPGERAAVLDRMADLLEEHKVDRLVVGDPMDEATNLGPLVSLQHRERVYGFVARAQAQGATAARGGATPDGPGAYYP